jgi:hypothetical protein
MGDISWLDDEVLASQDGLSSMEFVNEFVTYLCVLGYCQPSHRMVSENTESPIEYLLKEID